MTRPIKDIPSEEIRAWLDKGGCAQACLECSLADGTYPGHRGMGAYKEILRLREANVWTVRGLSDRAEHAQVAYTDENNYPLPQCVVFKRHKKSAS